MSSLAANVLDISSSPLLTTFLVLTCVTISAAALSRGKSKQTVHDIGGNPILIVWNFFTKRYDFMLEHFKTTGRKLIRFRILQHRVVAVTGKDFRKTFFSDASLNMGAYRILLGGLPSLRKIGKKDAPGPDLIKRLFRLIHKDRVAEVLPTLFEDVDRKMKDWGTEGTIDPFREVYDLVYQMTIRMATCRELSEDAQSIEKMKQLFWDIEESGTPTTILLPWFPGPAKRKVKQSTLGLYNLLKSYLNVRRQAQTPSSDAFDILIAEGASDDAIVGTVMNILFAGVVSTGVNSCWALLYLGSNPIWKQKATDELKAHLAKHTAPGSPGSLSERLSAIPVNAWEDEVPCLDLIIRETLRLTSTGTLLRRNAAKDLTFGETVVEVGDFMAYPLADVHLNPALYSNPLTFAPDRFMEGKEEDKKETFGYLAWGAGRHPCAGMKIAKLEMKLILALMLLGYEYELVDGSGKFPKTLPEPDRNNLLQASPLGDTCYLKFKRTE